MDNPEQKSLYEKIKKECLTVPFDLDLRNWPYQDDELEFKLIKKRGKTSYELNVYDYETYKSVHMGKYYKQELMDHMLKVFTEETKDREDPMYLYLYYDKEEQTFVHHRFR